MSFNICAEGLHPIYDFSLLNFNQRACRAPGIWMMALALHGSINNDSIG